MKTQEDDWPIVDKNSEEDWGFIHGSGSGCEPDFGLDSEFTGP